MARIVAISTIVWCFAFSLLPYTATAEATYHIIIVMDTIDDWSLELQDGFKMRMDQLLSGQNARAQYTEYNTEIKEEKSQEILQAIKQAQPDLICMLNYPSGFADIHIAQQLTAPQFRFVSENAVALEAGIIESWEKPGGNLTGVGVFLQLNSSIRLMKMINPKVKKLLFYSWEAMTLINEWFEREIIRACEEEGIELVEFKRIPHAEAEFEFLSRYADAGEEYFIMGGISAFVHEDGTPADMTKLGTTFVKETLRIPFIVYEDVLVRQAYIAGACVIWQDLGAQLAEKGIRILNGENPGDIPWSYPRQYNIVLNLQRAKELGLEFPSELISAAYRIYTDYEGNFVGRK